MALERRRWDAHRHAAVCLGLALSGCFYAQANVRYREHPELANVRLAAGKRQRTLPPPPNLGMVQVNAAGWASCDTVVDQALHDLLADARAMGGTGVAETRFLGRFTWIDRPVCRVTPFSLWLRKSVAVQGLAVKVDTSP